MKRLLEGVEKELRSAARVKLGGSLQPFRQRLNRDCVPRRCKQFQRDLNALLNSHPSLRAATRRYLSKRMQSALKASERILKRLDKPKKPVVN
ncbi:MAG: hypothetical protein WBD87_13430 [Candidatus Acidiferrales bacterium]